MSLKSYYYIIDRIETEDDEAIAFTISDNRYDAAVTSVDLSTCTASLSETSYIYDGEVKTPTVTVMDAKGSEIDSSNYTVSYSNNTDIGTATVTITGIGSYTGTIIKTFTISDEVGGTTGELEWFISSDGVLTITGTGDYSDTSYYPVWHAYSEYITSAVVDVTGITSTSKMFYGLSNMTSIDLSGLDTSDVINMEKMFYGCSGLTSIDVSDFDTSNVTNMASMFCECNGLRLLDVSDFNTSKVTGMSYMFCNCSSLTSLNLSGLDTSNVTYMYYMFYGCSRLTTLDISSFDTSNVTNMTAMFWGCASLMFIDVSGFDMSGVEMCNKMFHGCSSLTSLDLSNFKLDSLEISSDGWSGRYFDFSDCTSLKTLTMPMGYSFPDKLPYVEGYYWKDSDGVIRTATAEDVVTYTLEEVSLPLGGTEGDLIWSISKDGVLNISGTGDYITGYRASGFGGYVTDPIWTEFSSYITSAIVDVRGLTSTWRMFYGCDNLTSVDFSGVTNSSISDVGEMFYGCSSLVSLDLSNLNITSARPNSFDTYVFDGCSSLISITVPSFSYYYALELPEFDTCYWLDENGKTCTALAQNLTTAMTYTRYSDDLSYSTVMLDNESYVYNGDAKTPVVTVKNGTMVLTEGTDYTVTYSNNINIGIATVTVTGMGDYSGSKTATFEITEQEITTLTDSMVTLATKSYTYDGSAKEPTITVTYNDTVLTRGTDYTVSYSNNTNAGIATVTVIGKGNYTGTATATFTISKASQMVTASAASKSITYGKTTSISASTTGDGPLSYSSSNTSVATVNGSGVVTAKGAGTATITVTTSATDNYNAGTATVSITVTRASQTLSVSSTSVSLAVGGTSTPTVSGAKTTLSYSSSNTSVATVNSSGKITAKAVGTATITVTAAQTSSYSKATKTIKVTVKPAATTISKIQNTTSGVKITWNKVAGATKYYVYCSTSKSGTYTKIGETTSTSYTNKNSGTNKVSSGKNYYYKVYAYASTGKSAASSIKSIRYLAGKVSSLTNTSGGITVKWSKVSGASGYYIYRKAGSGSYQKIAKISNVLTVSYTNETKGTYKVVNGTTYTYYVVPYYKSGSSEISGTYTATKTTVRMTAVSLSSVKNTSSKKMTVKWSKNTKATGYQIQYSTSSTFASGNKTVTVTGASSSSRTIGSLTKNKTYYVRIRTYKTVSKTKYYSAWSSKKSVKISK